MTVTHRDQFAAKRDQLTATVTANVPLCTDHYRLVLRVARFAPTVPGQFIQVSCRDMSFCYSPQREVEWQEGQPFDLLGRELMSPLAMLRRPFSLMGRRDLSDGAVELQIMHRVVGTATAWLSHLKVGDQVNLIGPLGNGFELPPEGVPAILVGGGVGIPPMVYLASALAGRKAVAFCGVMTRDLLPLTVTGDAPAPTRDGIDPLYNIAEFAQHGVPAVISTNDGTYGFAGLVTQTLTQYLDRYFAPGGVAGVRPILYTCGPEAMMKAVAQIAAERALECQVAVERAMACGMGTCQSCVIKVRRPTHNGDRNWVYKLACTDGPVFKGSDLLW